MDLRFVSWLRRVSRPSGIGPLGVVVRGLHAWNARHPWSHNDHFHRWILRNLPEHRGCAVDIGCGQGMLVESLAPYFDHVHGTDLDADMRAAASWRTARLANVTIGARRMEEIDPGADLITMVAVLHHLDVEHALRQARELLAPGGRLLVVGLAPVHSLADMVWGLASVVTNPLIGFVKHPWPHRGPSVPDVFPTLEPEMSVRDLRMVLDRVMPGARLRRRLAFRHTIEWTKPTTGG